VQLLARAGDVEPYSARIVERVGFYHAAPAALLAWSRCRWGELGTVDLRDVIESRRVRILAEKGSADRWTAPVPREALRLWEAVDPRAPIVVSSYDSLTAKLYQAQEWYQIKLPTGCHAGTHLFRHLWASWRLSEGDSLTQIAEGLGHRSERSTQAYCHEYAALITQSPSME
jgi:integrase